MQGEEFQRGVEPAGAGEQGAAHEDTTSGEGTLRQGQTPTLYFNIISMSNLIYSFASKYKEKSSTFPSKYRLNGSSLYIDIYIVSVLDGYFCPFPFLFFSYKPVCSTFFFTLYLI